MPWNIEENVEDGADNDLKQNIKICIEKMRNSLICLLLLFIDLRYA